MFNILSSLHISAIFFTSIVWKLSINLRPQQWKGLKGVYGLKFFYLADDEKPFFTKWYANSKDVVVSGHEISHVDNDHCASCFWKYSHNENGEWIQCPVLCQHWFHEQFLPLVFFSPKFKICMMKIFQIYSCKNEFLSDGVTFLW